jgi:hypothetical protein
MAISQAKSHKEKSYAFQEKRTLYCLLLVEVELCGVLMFGYNHTSMRSYKA